MLRSFRNQNQRRSPLSEVQGMKSAAQGKKSHGKELAIALPLTSLIDAFSIIVIYLLIGTQSGAVETPVHNLNLPIASNSQGLEKEVSILRIQKGEFFLNDKKVTLQNLTEKLSELKKASDKDMELMVQADQDMQYSDLDPLIKAGSLAGIEKLKFAVMPSK